MKIKDGRPSKIVNFQKKKNLISLMYQRGFTDNEVALALDTTRTTLHNWKRVNKDFLNTKKNNKKIADEKVKVALFERACGYSHPEEQLFQYQGKVVRAETIKHYPPDTAACFIWLKNRNPENWKDKQELDLTMKEYLYASNSERSIEEIKKESARLAREIVGKRAGTQIPKSS